MTNTASAHGSVADSTANAAATAQGETRSFSAETAKVLQLMIHSLYTNKDIFLRELISNASDACDKLRYQAITQPALWADNPELQISLAVDKEKRLLIVRDSGIGMSREELIDHLGTIARSGTQAFAAAHTADAGNGASKAESTDPLTLIGQFGVGFYSAFMVAESIEVISRKAGSDAAHRWVSDGSGTFTVSPIEQTPPPPRGTEIRLHIKAGEEAYLDAFRLKHIVRTYSDHIAFPITLASEKGAAPETLNKASALWTRQKQDITPEQYQEFYRHVAHLPGEPWMVLHNKAEGKIEYTNLLFIPASRPFDLFHPERRRRVKLYVKRVFITDEGIDIIPHYLRFLQGVIDSEDVPLNISRETLQKNPVLEKISESVTKRVLNELKKKSEQAPEEYQGFWNNFGAVLKEGLCERMVPQELLLECCRFASTLHPEKGTSLADYLARMKPGQEAIYYLNGEDVEQLLRSPQLEGFIARGIEVLLLTDHVDDFWVNVIHQYKEKPLKSVTKADDALDNIAALSEKKDEKTEEENTTKNTPESAEPKDLEAFLALLQTHFAGKVKTVRWSHKLTQSPVCLAVDEGGMDFRMERFMLEHKQLNGKLPKILEVNPKHPLVIQLAKRAAAADAKEDKLLADSLALLLDQACIVEGEPIDDAKHFALRLSEMMARGLAA